MTEEVLCSDLRVEKSAEEGVCKCNESFIKGQMFSLPCKHFACKKCWLLHIQEEIRSTFQIKCFYPGCNCPMSVENVSYLTNQELGEQYFKIILNHRIPSSKFLKCSLLECQNLIRTDNKNFSDYRCSCGARTCHCKRQYHFPLSCQQFVEFTKDSTVEISRAERMKLGKVMQNLSEFLTDNCPLFEVTQILLDTKNAFFDSQSIGLFLPHFLSLSDHTKPEFVYIENGHEMLSRYLAHFLDQYKTRVGLSYIQIKLDVQSIRQSYDSLHSDILEL